MVMAVQQSPKPPLQNRDFPPRKTIDMSLFAPVSVGGSGSAASKNLIEFKAGKCTRDGTTVTPDARKGTLFMSMEDELLHFCWKTRGSGTAEDDLIIFPDEAELVKVTQSQGRVFVLKFKSSSQRHFFWAQEVDPSKDDSFLNTVNGFIKNPPPSHGMADGTASLMAALTGAAAATSPVRAQPAGTHSGHLERLREILASFSSSEGSATISPLPQIPGLSAAVIAPLLSNEAVAHVIFPTLPVKVDRTRGEVEAVMATPEFASCMHRLLNALGSGAVDLSNIRGLGDSLPGVKTFLKCLTDHLETANAMDEQD